MAKESLVTFTVSMKQQQEETIRKEEKRLFGFIRSRVDHLEDAEDIFQDVLEQFIDGYAAIGSMEKATRWLFRVASNKIIDLYRFRKVRSGHVKIYQETEDEDMPMMLRDILPDFGQSPEEVYFQNIIWEDITNALDDLPEEQRQVFVLHEFEGKNFKDIAQMLNKPVNTLISRKRYAVLALREKLKELYKDFEL